MPGLVDVVARGVFADIAPVAFAAAIVSPAILLQSMAGPGIGYLVCSS